ncbi:hypothetical protein [Marinomonas sp.]|uniref:hypothetical protein n=1 Tax=Marinomonas sp. TaxID=1904862 RepID=UPI003A8F7A29
MNLFNYKGPNFNFDSHIGKINIKVFFNLLDKCYPDDVNNQDSKYKDYLKIYLKNKSDFELEKIDKLEDIELQKISEEIVEKFNDERTVKYSLLDQDKYEYVQKEIKDIKKENPIECFYYIAKIFKKYNSKIKSNFKYQDLYSKETSESIEKLLNKPIFEPQQLHIEIPKIYQYPNHLEQSSLTLLKLAESLESVEKLAIKMISENEIKRREDLRSSRVQLWIAIFALLLPSALALYQIHDNNQTNKINTKNNNSYLKNINEHLTNQKAYIEKLNQLESSLDTESKDRTSLEKNNLERDLDLNRKIDEVLNTTHKNSKHTLENRTSLERILENINEKTQPIDSQ